MSLSHESKSRSVKASWISKQLNECRPCFIRLSWYYQLFAAAPPSNQCYPLIISFGQKTKKPRAFVYYSQSNQLFTMSLLLLLLHQADPTLESG
jgi:hypothetical protein